MNYAHVAVLMVQTWRNRRGLTMEQLADKLGMSQNALAAKLQRKTLDAALFLKIIRVLEIRTFDKEFDIILQDLGGESN